MSTKERPIIFSAPMVRAILEGKKTQTRRVVKPQPPDGAHPFFIMCSSNEKDEGKWRFTASKDHMSPTVLGPVGCPYGKPGERLWVRETWGLFNDLGFCDTSLAGLKQLPYPWQLAYRTDHVDPVNGDGPHRPCWRPSIHMPRWASRITLEVRSVKVERLQDISGPDCWAEGIEHAGWDCERYGSVVECYRDLWQSINGADSWDANPWVWVVEFQRIEVAS